MTAATFDHHIGKSLEFFQQQRNERTACSHFKPNRGLVAIRDSLIGRLLRNLPLLLILLRQGFGVTGLATPVGQPGRRLFLLNRSERSLLLYVTHV